MAKSEEMARIIVLSTLTSNCTFGDCEGRATRAVVSADEKKVAPFCDRHINEALRRWQEWEDEKAY